MLRLLFIILILFPFHLARAENINIQAIEKECMDKRKDMADFRECLGDIVEEYKVKLFNANERALQRARDKIKRYQNDPEFQFNPPRDFLFVEKQKASNASFEQYLQDECEFQLYEVEGNAADADHLLCQIKLIDQRLSILTNQ